jgi:hypothetical protein
MLGVKWLQEFAALAAKEKRGVISRALSSALESLNLSEGT